jgi:hypothetical protein
MTPVSDRCSSTILCASADQEAFEALGYRLGDAKARGFDGEEVPGAVIMIDHDAPGGHYDELIAMKGTAFVAHNTACPGVWGDHRIASDGRAVAYAEALHESNYPAIRVNPEEGILEDDLNAARSYWQVYANAMKTITEQAEQTAHEGRDVDEVDFKG